MITKRLTKETVRSRRKAATPRVMDYMNCRKAV
jgi:hypothetical protein